MHALMASPAPRRSLVSGPLFLLAFTWLSAGALPVAHGQPTITSANPSAVKPGEETEVVFTGTKLEGTLRFWTSFPAEVQILEQAEDGTRVKCKLTLAETTPLQVGGVLLANEQGLTDTLWLMVDDLTTIPEAGDNNRLETAQPLTLPVAIDGVSNGTESDYFRFDAEQGEVVSFDVYAARLGSGYDPLLRVLDSDGNELAMEDDLVAIGADCRHTLAIPESGTYYVELRDSRYAAGGRYRLRLGDFPAATVAYPAGVRQGALTEVQFPDTDFPGASLLVKSDALPPALHHVNVRRDGGSTSTPVPVIVSDLPEYASSGSNHDPGEATRVSVPAGMSGILSPGKRDYFEFLAAANDRLEFRGLARSIGSPAYPLLRIWNAEGTQLAESPVGESDEPTLAFAFPADGLYRLSVEDLLRGGGAQHAYRVEARRVPFTLGFKTPNEVSFKATLNSHIGAWVVVVTCQRHHYDGPITVRMDPPSPHFEWIQNTIPEKANEARLVLAARHTAAPGMLAPARLVGEAVVQGQRSMSVLSPLASVRATWPMMISPPPWQREQVAFSTGLTPPPFFELNSETPRTFFPRGIGKATARLSSVRLDGEFTEGLAPIITRGPEGVRAEVKSEGDVHEVTLSGPADLPAGSYPIEFTAWGNLKGRWIVQRADLLLDVHDPVTLSIPPIEPLLAGETRKVTIAAVRHGDERHPIAVRFPQLPAGVTLSETTIPAEADQVEVELAVAAEATPGRLGRLTATATSHYQEQEVQSSHSVVLEVQAVEPAEAAE
jgi:hypothetical protein